MMPLADMSCFRELGETKKVFQSLPLNTLLERKLELIEE